MCYPEPIRCTAYVILGSSQFDSSQLINERMRIPVFCFSHFNCNVFEMNMAMLVCQMINLNIISFLNISFDHHTETYVLQQ